MSKHKVIYQLKIVKNQKYEEIIVVTETILFCQLSKQIGNEWSI